MSWIGSAPICERGRVMRTRVVLSIRHFRFDLSDNNNNEIYFAIDVCIMVYSKKKQKKKEQMWFSHVVQ